MMDIAFFSFLFFRRIEATLQYVRVGIFFFLLHSTNTWQTSIAVAKHPISVARDVLLVIDTKSFFFYALAESI